MGGRNRCCGSLIAAITTSGLGDSVAGLIGCANGLSRWKTTTASPEGVIAIAGSSLYAGEIVCALSTRPRAVRNTAFTTEAASTVPLLNLTTVNTAIIPP